MMSFFCRLGAHRWIQRLATYNPHRLVKRCRSCGVARVVHLKKPVSVIDAPQDLSNIPATEENRPASGKIIYDERMLRGRHVSRASEEDRVA